MRAALGAGKERLVRQLITESVVLALLGGSAGVLVAALGVPLFSSLVPPTLPIASQPASGLTRARRGGVVHSAHRPGLRPLPRASRGRRAGFAALREGNRAGGGRKQRVRAVLVTVEVTMSVILLITSGLLIRAVWRVQAIDPGFCLRTYSRSGRRYRDPSTKARCAALSSTSGFSGSDAPCRASRARRSSAACRWS